jgi:hypothetical protein
LGSSWAASRGEDFRLVRPVPTTRHHGPHNFGESSALYDLSSCGRATHVKLSEGTPSPAGMWFATKETPSASRGEADFKFRRSAPPKPTPPAQPSTRTSLRPQCTLRLKSLLQGLMVESTVVARGRGRPCARARSSIHKCCVVFRYVGVLGNAPKCCCCCCYDPCTHPEASAWG